MDWALARAASKSKAGSGACARAGSSRQRLHERIAKEQTPQISAVRFAVDIIASTVLDDA